MKINITRQEAQDHFPNEIETLIGSISKLKMFNKYGIDKVNYAFSYMVRLGEYKTDQEYLDAVAGLGLIVYFSPNKGVKRIALDTIPTLFKDKYIKLMHDGRKKHEKEMARIASLSEEDRNKERQDILQKLTGMGGFYQVNIIKKK